jgi:hypothetical protein
MTDRDELAALETVLTAHQRHRGGCLCGWGELGRSHPMHQAEQILARWRLVPVEEARASGGHIFTMRHADGCTCGYDRNAAQHRAADELTQHDQNAGIYDGPRLPPFDPTNPAMLSAAKEYFEHGFDNATIIRASFPGLTPEIVDALRTDNHGPHED